MARKIGIRFQWLGQWSKKARCLICIKCVVFIYWQGMLKLCFILSLPVAFPEIPLHIGMEALYDNTSPTWEIFLSEISVKIVNVMCCFNLLFLQLRNYSKSVAEISFDKVVSHFFGNSMSLVTQDAPPWLGPSG